MLDKIRKLLGLSDVPEEVSSLYRGARSEREALILLKEARRRDEARRRRAMQDLEELDRMEEELLEEGKGEMSDNRRLMIARRVKDIRGKMQELNSRIESIYNKRLKIYNEHVTSLETVLELKAEEIPDKEAMESVAIKAKQLLEDLEITREKAEGISLNPDISVGDDEEKEIIKEMERRAQESPKKEVEEEEEEEEEEEVTTEPVVEEPKRSEKQRETRQEPPEIMFED